MAQDIYNGNRSSFLVEKNEYKQIPWDWPFKETGSFFMFSIWLPMTSQVIIFFLN